MVALHNLFPMDGRSAAYDLVRFQRVVHLQFESTGT
jgi:hypothetical protein